MRHIIALLALTSAMHCGRVEEPVRREAGTSAPVVIPPPPAASRPGDAPIPAAAPAATPSPEPTRCVTPMPQRAPQKAAVAQKCPADPATTPPELPRGRIGFPNAPGQPSITVELARAPEHRMRGLMYRTSLPADGGMLFSWSGEEPRSFWMRNTCIPLDMLFIDRDGTIVGVLEQVPTLNDDARTVACPAQHVLEVNAGWTRAHGVQPGQKITIEG